MSSLSETLVNFVKNKQLRCPTEHTQADLKIFEIRLCVFCRTAVCCRPTRRRITLYIMNEVADRGRKVVAGRETQCKVFCVVTVRSAGGRSGRNELQKCGDVFVVVYAFFD